MRSELLRLLDGLEVYRSWRIASVKRETGRVTQDDLNQIVMPSEMFLEMFEDAGTGERRLVLNEVKTCFSHIGHDLSELRKTDDQVARKSLQEFLDGFREKTGVDFFVESGFLRTLVGKVLKRGRITSDEEYESLKELETSSVTGAFTEADILEISQMLRRFERGAEQK